MTNVSPWIIHTLTLPSLLASTVVVLRLTVERWVGMERQDLSYDEGVHTRFTSSGPSQRK